MRSFIILLVLTTIIASSLAGKLVLSKDDVQNETNDIKVDEEARGDFDNLPEKIQPAGFGCPGNDYQCHSHCLSIGRRGGYCGGFLWAVCTCYT